MEKCFAGDGTSMARYVFSLVLVAYCHNNSVVNHCLSILKILEASTYTLQLGLGDVIDRNIPVEVPMENCNSKNVACGWWHTLLLAESPT